jgi:hypothetical protein
MYSITSRVIEILPPPGYEDDHEILFIYRSQFLKPSIHYTSHLLSSAEFKNTRSLISIPSLHNSNVVLNWDKLASTLPVTLLCRLSICPLKYFPICHERHVPSPFSFCWSP